MSHESVKNIEMQVEAQKFAELIYNLPVSELRSLLDRADSWVLSCGNTNILQTLTWDKNIPQQQVTRIVHHLTVGLYNLIYELYQEKVSCSTLARSHAITTSSMVCPQRRNMLYTRRVMRHAREGPRERYAFMYRSGYRIPIQDGSESNSRKRPAIQDDSESNSRKRPAVRDSSESNSRKRPAIQDSSESSSKGPAKRDDSQINPGYTGGFSKSG